MQIIGTGPIPTFLREAGSRPFEHGMWDCGRYIAEWVRRSGHDEPGTEFIGQYANALGLVRLLKRRGGIVAHFDQCLAAVGVLRTDEPKRGDVALVTIAEELGGEVGCDFLAGAIVLEETAAILEERGLVVLSLQTTPIKVAWRV